MIIVYVKSELVILSTENNRCVYSKTDPAPMLCAKLNFRPLD